MESKIHEQPPPQQRAAKSLSMDIGVMAEVFRLAALETGGDFSAMNEKLLGEALAARRARAGENGGGAG